MSVDEKRKEYEAQQQKAMANRPKSGQMVTLDNARIKELLQGKMDSLEKAIPQTAKKFLTPERIVKVVGMAVSKNPKLLECTGTSILISTMDAVSLGLEPGGPLEHAYLVPFYNGKTRQMEAKCIVSFKGYMDLARRSKEITSIACQLVYEKDLDSFDIDLANHMVKHRPYMGAKGRGEWVAGYCSAKFRNGDTQLEFMTRESIMKVRDQAMAKLKKDWLKQQSPWTQHEEEMARKTVVRRARKYWPLSVETQQSLAQAERIDDTAHEFVEPTRTDMVDVVDITPHKEPEPDKPTEPAELPPATDDEPDSSETESENPEPEQTEIESTGELPLADRKVDKRKKPITPYQIEKLYSAIKGVKPSATPDDVVAYCERVVKGKLDSIESLYATDFDDIMAQVENDKDIRR